MNEAQTYPVQSAWRGAIRALRGAQPGIFLTGQIVPVIFWLLVVWYESFSRDAWFQSAAPLPFLIALGLLSTLAQRFGLKKRRNNLRLTRWIVLLNNALGGLYLITLSGYTLRLSIAVAAAERALPSLTGGLILGLYVATAAYGVLWSPRSVPRSKAADEQAATRDIKWLPRILGAQGALVGISVFFSTWAARSRSPGKDVWLVCLTVFGALFMVFFGVLSMYRFIFLALHPIPPEVREEFSLRS